jgi:hypothetical protein
MSRPVFSARRLFRRALILAHRFVFGSLLAGLLLILAVLYGGLIFTKHKLSQGIDAGTVAVRAQGLRVGWDLCLRVDSVQVQSPTLNAHGNGVRLRPVLAKNFWAVFPSLKLSIVTLDLNMLSKDSAEPGSGKAPTFPELRWPMPWSIDIGSLAVHAGGREQAVLNDVQLASRGMLGVIAKATVKAGEWGHTLPASLQAGLKCEVRARWKGPELAYLAQVRTVQGDSLVLQGRRQRDDLRLAKDSLTLLCDRPSLYAPESLALALAPYRQFAASLRLDTRKRMAYAAKLSFRADTLPLLGGSNITTTLRGGLSRAWVGVDLQTFAGGKAHILGEVPFQKLEMHDTSVAALGRLRPARGSFSASMKDLNLTVGEKILPADGQLRDGIFAPGLVTARLLTAAGSEMHVVFHLALGSWLDRYQYHFCRHACQRPGEIRPEWGSDKRAGACPPSAGLSRASRFLAPLQQHYDFGLYARLGPHSP